MWHVAGVLSLQVVVFQLAIFVMKVFYKQIWTMLQWQVVLFAGGLCFLIALACLTPQCRRNVREVLASNSAYAAAAAGVAQIISEQNPVDVLKRARATFVC